MQHKYHKGVVTFWTLFLGKAGYPRLKLILKNVKYVSKSPNFHEKKLENFPISYGHNKLFVLIILLEILR